VPGVKGRTRWVGIFDGPGVFCVVYTIALPFVLPLLRKPFSIPTRVFGFLALALLSVAIYYNGSRGGFLTSLAIVGMHFSSRIKRNKLIVPIAAALLIGLFVMAPPHMTSLSDGHRSASHRVEMWAEGCEMLKQNPIFGIGRLGFKQYTASLVGHSSFVEIMGETGAIGLFAWMGLFYFSLKALYLFVTRKDEEGQGADLKDRLLARGLFISIVGYLISALFVTLEYETIYMLLALATVFGRQLPGPLQVTRTDVLIIGSVELAWIIFINAFTILLGPGHFLP
jgi:O-antigen ligase